MDYTKLPSEEVISKTINSLRENGFQAFTVENKEEAKEKTLALINEDEEVMTMTSVTLEQTGIFGEIGKFKNAVRKKLTEESVDEKLKRQLGAAPDAAIGSVHAVTEQGELYIASNTGSQLPAYAYGAQKVIFVVGMQKIVKNSEQAIKRIYEHALPLEQERAKKAYRIESHANKILTINKELQENRITIILVKELLGF